MRAFWNKRGIISAHPMYMLVVGIVIGLVLAYVWINYINFANPYCPAT